MKINLRAHPYPTFLALSLTAYLGLETSAEFIACFIVKGGDVLKNLEEGFSRAIMIWEFGIPYYGVLGLICGSLAKKSGFKYALILFVLGVITLGGLGFMSAFYSQTALMRHAWTASTLSYLAFVAYGLPVLAACLVIRLLAGKKSIKSGDKYNAENNIQG